MWRIVKAADKLSAWRHGKERKKTIPFIRQVWGWNFESEPPTFHGLMNSRRAIQVVRYVEEFPPLVLGLLHSVRFSTP